MTKYLVSSKDTEGLTEGNHLHNIFKEQSKEEKQDIIEALFGVKCNISDDLTQEKGRKFGVEHTVTDWIDNQTFRNGDSSLDIVLLKKGDRKTWIPFVEYKMIEEAIKVRTELTSVRWGYIDGRKHHLTGYDNPEPYHRFDAYIIFIECTHTGEDSMHLVNILDKRAK